MNSNEVSPGEFVAPLLPATSPMPEPLRKRYFLTDFLLYWLMPSKRGPHLAARSMGRALLAQLLVVVTLLGFLFSDIVLDLIEHTMSERPFEWSLLSIRNHLAYLILIASEPSSYGFNKRMSVLVLAGTLPALYVLLFGLGTLLMPFAAGGDRPWSVWKRSLKNVFWSTTYFIPGSLIVWLIIQLDDINMRSEMHHLPDWLIITGWIIIILISVLLLVFWIRAMIVGAGTYVGEPDGPAWSEREPLCDDCGYSLIHLPLDSRCPECGLGVSESLPGGRRQPTEWSLKETGRRKLRDFLRMQWAVLRDRDYFKKIPVQQKVGPARHFWWMNTLCLLSILMLLGGVIMVVNWGYYTYFGGKSFLLASHVGPSPLHYVLFILPAPFLLQLMINFPASLWAQWRYGIRDFRVSTTVCSYAAPLMIPGFIVLYLFLIVWVSWIGKIEDLFPLVEAGQYARFSVFLVFLILLLVGVVFALLRLSRAMANVKYANV